MTRFLSLWFSLASPSLRNFLSLFLSPEAFIRQWNGLHSFTRVWHVGQRLDAETGRFAWKMRENKFCYWGGTVGKEWVSRAVWWRSETNVGWRTHSCGVLRALCLYYKHIRKLYYLFLVKSNLMTWRSHFNLILLSIDFYDFSFYILLSNLIFFFENKIIIENKIFCAIIDHDR